MDIHFQIDIEALCGVQNIFSYSELKLGTSSRHGTHSREEVTMYPQRIAVVAKNKNKDICVLFLHGEVGDKMRAPKIPTYATIPAA